MMLDTSILGFLYERPMHGYELKQHLNMLTGYYRPVSDGALYPAISRLEKHGFLFKQEERGQTAAPRLVLCLTDEGRREVIQRLQNPSSQDISDRNRFFTLLSFLRFVPPANQKSVLEQRLQFLDGGKSFFQEDGKPVTLSDELDPFRKGMLHIAKETKRVERKWLRETIESLEAENE